MSGKFAASLSREDFVAAYWFYTRWLWLWKRLAIAFVIVTTVYLLLIAGMFTIDGSFELSKSMEYLRFAVIGALLVTVAIISISLITFPWRLKRLYDDLKVAGRETSFEFDQAGIRVANRDGSANYNWDRFKHMIENGRFLLLVLSRYSFIVVPKAQVSGEMLEALRGAAQAGGVAAR
jgi:hypothetical protein